MNRLTTFLGALVYSFLLPLGMVAGFGYIWILIVDYGESDIDALPTSNKIESGVLYSKYSKNYSIETEIVDNVAKVKITRNQVENKFSTEKFNKFKECMDTDDSLRSESEACNFMKK